MMMNMQASVLGAILLLHVIGPSATADQWLRFRGPDGSGISADTRVALYWSQEKNIRWRTPLPAPGNSSPIVVGEVVFITCATEQGRHRSLYCFDRSTGKQRWVRTVEFDGDELTHRTNPYCGSTPASDGKRVVVWHSSAGLHCYDLGGNELWQRDLGRFIHIWGYAASPIYYKNRVILNAGPGERTFMIALDGRTGQTMWKTDEPGGASGLVKINPEDKRAPWIGSWSTPVVASVDGKDQVLVSYPNHVKAYDAETGKVVWQVDGLGQLVYTSVLVDDGIGVAMSRRTKPAMGFRLGGTGNVTASNRLWLDDSNNPQRIGSGIILGKHLFLVNATGVAQCFEVVTGKELWRARVPDGGVWGSLVFVRDRLLVTNQKGNTVVFMPRADQFELSHVNELNEPSNSTPAISDGQIFIRTFNALYCIEETHN